MEAGAWRRTGPIAKTLLDGAGGGRRHRDSGRVGGRTRRSGVSKPKRSGHDLDGCAPPFASIGPGSAGDYLNDGLTEELIDALSKVKGMQVVAWSSAAQMKGKMRDVRAAGRQLGVGSVLQGSVRSEGTRLRVTAQLVNVASGQYLWSQTYERDSGGIFEIQDDISRSIVGALEVRLSEAGEQPAVRPAPTLEAYQNYLKARHFLSLRTPDGMQKSVEYFERAIQSDGEYSLAYAGLADAYALLAIYGNAGVPLAIARAKAAAAKALELDPTLAEPHASLGLLRAGCERDWDGAEREFRLAIERNAGYANAHHWYAATVLVPKARFDEAAAETQRAQELDPLSLMVSSKVAEASYFAGRYDLAMEQLKKTFELDPNSFVAHHILGMIYERKGMYAQAQAEFETTRRLNPGFLAAVVSLGHIYALQGKTIEARKILAEMESIAARAYYPAAYLAVLHADLGDIDGAFRLLRKGCGEGNHCVTYLKVSPRYAPLRRDPRFTELLKELRLE
jgi:eukaryotic-like serine/threonine-protein kinase